MTLFTASATIKGAALLAVVFAASGCCSGPHCPDKFSGGDYPRTEARWLQTFDKVINDHVSWPKKDRTDWRYVVIPKKGTLTVELHWDNGKAGLELSVWDEMGIRIQDGRVWSSLGLRCVVAIETPGRYFIRVATVGEDDESLYSLRVAYVPTILGVCDPCEADGLKKCFGDNGYKVCGKQTVDCLKGWSETITCPADQVCEEGACVARKVATPDPTPPPPTADCKRVTGCRSGARKCEGQNTYRICNARPRKCHLDWSQPVVCPGKEVCDGGQCKGEKGPPPCVEGKITSMYASTGGETTLHIQLQGGHGVRAGNIGHVLKGNSKQPLPNGTFKVHRVSSDYCVAHTSLSSIGQNLNVCIVPSQ